MKVIRAVIAFCLTLSVIFSISGCRQRNIQNNSSESDLRKIAWDQLSVQSRKEIVGDWKDAECNKTVVDSEIMNLLAPEYDGKEVWHVIFHTKRDGILGPIGVYLSLDTHQIIGGDYRE